MRRLPGRLDQVERLAERLRVLHVDVREDRDVRRDVAPQPQRGRGVALDNALISHASTRVDIDADEVKASGRCDGQRTGGIVAEHVDAAQRVAFPGQRCGDPSHRRDDVRRDRALEERRIAEVLEDPAVQARLEDRVGIGGGRSPRCSRGSLPCTWGFPAAVSSGRRRSGLFGIAPP
jgi:hypothetical protein